MKITPNNLSEARSRVKTRILLAVGSVLFLSGAVAPVISGLDVVNAATPIQQLKNGAKSASSDTSTKLEDYIKSIVNILSFVIGSVAVLMIAIGAFRYAVSGGDQAAITAAKNTILYAVIGLIVAVIAYAVPAFVIDGLMKAKS
jgi:hypothetical protein